MIDLYDELLAPLGVGLASPRDPDRRGSHLAFTHPDGLAISRHLRSTGQVVVDFRAPDTIRMAVAPLYTTYTEIWEAVSALADTVSSRSYADDATGGLVT